jgi:[acyl-carrier-protein] S-malonyltransferase
MAPAQARLADDLSALEYSDFEFPIVHNVDAESNDTAATVASKLTEQVSSPVRWLQTIERLKGAGVTKFVEIGPGKVLSGLIRQIDKEAEYANIEDTEGLRNTLETS